jgi:hypothetical protein
MPLYISIFIQGKIFQEVELYSIDVTILTSKSKNASHLPTPQQCSRTFYTDIEISYSLLKSFSVPQSTAPW